MRPGGFQARRWPLWSRSAFVLVAAALTAGLSPGASRVSAENLARGAAYSVVLSGFTWRGQVLPGTNTPAATNGYTDAPPWQGPPDTLTDGRRDGNAVISWFWSNMDKRVRVRLDLRRMARVAALRIWPRAGAEPPFHEVTATIRAHAPDGPAVGSVRLQAAGGGFAWSGEPLEGRFVEVLCTSRAPQITLAEVEVEGEPLGPIAGDAPPPGLQPAPRRDLAALVNLPERGAGVVNAARSPDVRLRVTARHTDANTGAWTDDLPVPEAAVLADGDPATALRSFRGWYLAKSIAAELDLARQWQIERVVVWSAGHGGDGAYVNAFTVWLQAGPGGAWTPVGETRNLLLPGERPASEYPIASAPIGRPAQRVRVQITGAPQSADVVQVGEVEVWARPLVRPVAVVRLRVKRPVPPIRPIRLGRLSRACEWIQKERIRALYGYVGQWRDAGLLDSIVAAGFNAVLVHTMGATHKADEWPHEAAAWARVQRERKLHVIVSWPFGSDERYANTPFGAYHSGGTTQWTRTPCPLSERYWERVIGDRAVVAARAGLTGLVVDMEMYGADSTRYAGPCYCDRCFTRFASEHLTGAEPQGIALADRPAWMAGNGLATAYARWQELRVSAILRRIERRAHAVAPGFLLGNLLDPESLPGLARGFGTPSVPALIFSELEYGGNVAGTVARLQRLRREGYPALYVSGFSTGAVTPPQLPALAVQVGTQGAGYWIWSSAAFAPNASGEYAHAAGFSHADYWRAFRAANDALDAALVAPSRQHPGQSPSERASRALKFAPGESDNPSERVLQRARGRPRQPHGPVDARTRRRTTAS